MKKQVKIALVLLIIGLFVTILIGYKWFENRKLYASTDAFFVKSDKIANVSFKRIAGKIVKMNFKEGDRVKAGDILAVIDSTDYQTQLEKINHSINALSAEKDALTVNKDKTEKSLKIEKNIKRDTLKSVEKEIESFKENINEVDIQLSQLEKDYNRYKNLREQKAVSAKSYEDIQTNLQRLKAKKASLSEKLKSLYYSKQIAEKDLALVDVKLKIIFEMEKKLESLDEQINALKKDREDITKMIEYCKLLAPFDGVIGQKYAEEGSVVKAGSYIYSLVDTTNLYGYVLMEEEKIIGVNPGDVAEIKIDAYPDEKFEGEVVEIFPASAATYALVPRDISAGEFTKVSQRIPIRVKFTSGNLEILRVGLGGEIKIKR